MLEKQPGRRRGAHLTCAAPKPSGVGGPHDPRTRKTFSTPLSWDRPGQLPDTAAGEQGRGQDSPCTPGATVPRKQWRKRLQHRWPNASGCVSLAGNVKFHHLVFWVNI